MAANQFHIEGKRIDSYADFEGECIDGTYSNLLYYPDEFSDEEFAPLVIKNKIFSFVSFKDTNFINVRFIECQFNNCLFIGAGIIKCEFSSCTFLDTNTSKVRIKDTLLDPTSFDNNFNLVNDTNIAVDLYHSLYKNSIENRQPEYAVNSLYKMKQAESKQFNSKLKRGKITFRRFLKDKVTYVLWDFVSGYGLKLWKVFRLLILIIAVFASVNYYFRDSIFASGDIRTFTDAIYFTCVTVTTLGYGDITPCTPLGKMLIVAQALLGFLVLSLFISGFTSRAMRTK